MYLKQIDPSFGFVVATAAAERRPDGLYLSLSLLALCHVNKKKLKHSFNTIIQSVLVEILQFLFVSKDKEDCNLIYPEVVKGETQNGQNPIVQMNPGISCEVS